MESIPIVTKDEIVHVVRTAAKDQLPKLNQESLVIRGIPAQPIGMHYNIEAFSIWLDGMFELFSLELPETFVIKDAKGHLLLYSRSACTYCDKR